VHGGKLEGIDTNHDGKVDVDEWVAYMAAFEQTIGAREFVRTCKRCVDVLNRSDEEAVPGHPLRAVSVAYLNTTFLAEVEAAELQASSKIYEIKDAVILAKGKNVTCPRDGELGAAYVDCVPQGPANRASVMLSYTWGYAVGDIASALADHCAEQGKEPEATFAWLCCLCINQHRVDEARAQGVDVPFETFRMEFESRVRSIRIIVALLTPWDKPLYLERVWCCFELYTAVTTEGCAVEIAMPKREASSLHSALQGQRGLGVLWESLNGVSIKHAKSSVEQDRTNIFRLIEKGPGFAKLNEAVAFQLNSWICGSAERFFLKANGWLFI
jgi:hypothetical protein